MIIGIILHPYGEEKPGGLSRTIFEWTSALLRNDRENQYLIFLKNNLGHQPALPGNPEIASLGGGKLWLDNLRRFPELDLCLFQTPVLPPIYKPKRAVIIAQDFPYKHLKPKDINERIKNNFIFRYHRRSLIRAQAVIAVSEATKDDLIKFFKVPEEKIEVIPMGYKNICALPEAHIDLPRKFFLYAGVIKERKNILNIVKAFSLFKKNQQGSLEKLVLAGKDEGDYADGIKQFTRKNNLATEIVFLGYLNDYQLSAAYRRAIAFVFPSLVEGFGFPVLEAMSCGVPVITSNIMGPSEIGKDAALLVDPRSPKAIAEAMRKIVSDKNLRAELIRKGLARAKEYSWDKTALRTLDLIRKLSF